MTTEGKAYTIVAGIDFSEASDHALDEALTLSVARQAELHVLYVDEHIGAAEGGHEAAQAALERVEKHALARMEDLGKRQGRPVSFPKLYSHFRLGAAAEQVVQLASSLNADLVVVGTHGRSGLKRLVLGSVAEQVVRLARCPVWVVRPKDHEGRAKTPEIEPPCSDCLAVRAETKGATFWCERHAEHHMRAHHYHYQGGVDRGKTAGFTSTPT